MFMRIISGKYKGRVLEGFDMKGTRPTMDRVKESLFAMIQNWLPNSTILDLFSGSGNLGLEALSEGASFAYLVDESRKAIETIQKNIRNLKISEVEVLEMDYLKAVKYLQERKVQVDIIFLDPPYATNYIEKSIEKIEEYHLLKEEGIIVCESNQLEKIVHSKTYKVIKEKKYGDKYIEILKKV